MKHTFIIILSLLACHAYAQDMPSKNIQTQVSEATVFLEGAQVTRSKSIDLKSGMQNLKFIKLSPFIDAKSIQVKAKGNLRVLAVNHQQNYLDQAKKSQEILELEKKRDDLDASIHLENTYLEILNEELQMLNLNRDLGGKEQALSTSALKEAALFYKTRLTQIKMEQIDKQKRIKDLRIERQKINDQIIALSAKTDYPTGEIVVKIDAKTAGSAHLEISYLVNNVNWFPSYDIRAKNISEPVQITYKAQIRQDTKVDWKNVKLRLSSSNPNVSGLAPELSPYWLSYDYIPSALVRNISQVAGIVTDAKGQAIPGVSIKVAGTSIGTISDPSGRYSISIPSGQQALEYSIIGYQSQVLPVGSSQMNIRLHEDMQVLDEVVVTGLGVKKSTRHKSLQSHDKLESEALYLSDSYVPPSIPNVKQTSVEFEIKTAYTILSDNKAHTVEIDMIDLPASYQYYCVPKLDPDAFLIAHVTNWEQYNFLDGEANIFFEGTYIGQTLLNLSNGSDTLQLSLGRDKNVSIQREKLKDFTSKKFIGSKKEETLAWQIKVKNNKQQAIQLLLLDQVPVSMDETIEVEVIKVSKAKFNAQTGEVKWELQIAPASGQDLELQYKVKYPKNRNLIID